MEAISAVAAVDLAARFETVVAFPRLPVESDAEGRDRVDIDLPPDQVALLRAVAAVNERVVVVLVNGSVTTTAPWRECAAAIVDVCWKVSTRSSPDGRGGAAARAAHSGRTTIPAGGSRMVAIGVWWTTFRPYRPGVRVLELWRYPVKSMQGEQLTRAEVTIAGIEGDRQFALFDAASGDVLTARRDPQLLFARAAFTGAGAVRIVLPDGEVAGDDAALSQWLGRPVQLRSAEPAPTHSPGSPDGYFQDSTEARVSLMSLATVGAWAPRRFRSNVLLDGEGEDGLVGSEVELGSVRLAVGMHIERCVMTTRPQPGGIDRDREVLRVIHREHGGTLSVGATVSRPGHLRVGDILRPLSVAREGGPSPAAGGPDQG